MNLILGAGLAGLSCSYHFGHDQCRILEKNGHAFGHLHVETRDGYTWDQGPHVSFTKHEYVRELFGSNTAGEFDEYPVRIANYFEGGWIDHPAQTSLYQIPEPLRSACLQSFLASRDLRPQKDAPANYEEWLHRAFGPVFADTFPARYTRKYWTRDPRDLGTSWLGNRVFDPAVDEVVAGSKGPLGRATHYITTVRYPRRGGYQSFVRRMAEGADIRYGSEVARIDLKEKCVWTASGQRHGYGRLVNTLPLPVFVAACVQATPAVHEAARTLSCSQLLLVNVMAEHPTARPENWIYVYDDEFLSTRINCTEKLTLANAPAGKTGVQVEVYFSRHKPLGGSPEAVRFRVEKELQIMGLIGPSRTGAGVSSFTSYCPWANVIFDLERDAALAVIFDWLERHGLVREPDDLAPMTNWNTSASSPVGSLALAGRFGQWKYFWTDDCVLQGRRMAESIRVV